ncbi:MAG: hypothetical protein HQL94_10870 [Magnetococcales bacterium]|nr:hypothetical protein [Magnetococcales bacterium]
MKLPLEIPTHEEDVMIAAGIASDPDTYESFDAEILSMRPVQKSSMDELATKSDLRELKLELMAEIKLNRWMLALVVAATVLPALKTLLGW